MLQMWHFILTFVSTKPNTRMTKQTTPTPELHDIDRQISGGCFRVWLQEPPVNKDATDGAIYINVNDFFDWVFGSGLLSGHNDNANQDAALATSSGYYCQVRDMFIYTPVMTKNHTYQELLNETISDSDILNYLSCQ